MSFHEVQWYDRKPTSNGDRWSAAALAPHGLTTRLTYTVPKGKIAMVEVMQARLERVDVAAPAGRPQANWIVTPNGGLAIYLLHAFTRGNIMGDGDGVAIGATLMLFEGDRLWANTVDDSTGGSMDYHLSYKITEFDAYLYHATPKTRPRPEIDVQEAKPRPDPVM